MAFLNHFKKQAERRSVAYQVIMADLIEMGVVDKEKYAKLVAAPAHIAVQPPAIPAAEVPVVPENPDLFDANTCVHFAGDVCDKSCIQQNKACADFEAKEEGVNG